MVEQQVVLEHEAGRSLLGLDEDPGCRFVDAQAVDGDAPGVERFEAGEAAQHGGLAGTVRTEQRDQLAGPHFQIDMQIEGAELLANVRGQAHLGTAVGGVLWRPPNQRSRNPINTAKETAISTSASTMACSGFVSRAR
ncbi:MAG: hypothetical protein FD127_1653 [Acidimicrobiaceae bacterium]|nr:MAG: hypothetical protein FD127_1653 [Acidimicrobiaceae bacterium]